jgi:hypothetical protein
MHLGDGVYEVKGTFETKGYGVSRKNISATLNFSLSDIDVEQLAHFAANTGKLIIDVVGPLEDESPAPDAGPQKKLFGEAWRDEAIETLDGVSIAGLKKLREGGLTTIGKLATYTSAGFKLANLVGKKHGEEVENASIAFFKAHPECTSA